MLSGASSFLWSIKAFASYVKHLQSCKGQRDFLPLPDMPYWQAFFWYVFSHGTHLHNSFLAACLVHASTKLVIADGQTPGKSLARGVTIVRLCALIKAEWASGIAKERKKWRLSDRE